MPYRLRKEPITVIPSTFCINSETSSPTSTLGKRTSFVNSTAAVIPSTFDDLTGSSLASVASLHDVLKTPEEDYVPPVAGIEQTRLIFEDVDSGTTADAEPNGGPVDYENDSDDSSTYLTIPSFRSSISAKEREELLEQSSPDLGKDFGKCEIGTDIQLEDPASQFTSVDQAPEWSLDLDAPERFCQKMEEENANDPTCLPYLTERCGAPSEAVENTPFVLGSKSRTPSSDVEIHACLAEGFSTILRQDEEQSRVTAVDASPANCATKEGGSGNWFANIDPELTKSSGSNNVSRKRRALLRLSLAPVVTSGKKRCSVFGSVI